MADARLQQLRRAWDEGDLDTQVRLLRERMRAGELAEERVRLAALLGDKASGVAWGDGPADVLAELRDWVDPITRLGSETAARAALAAVRLELDSWEAISGDTRPRVAVETAESHLVDSSSQDDVLHAAWASESAQLGAEGDSLAAKAAAGAALLLVDLAERSAYVEARRREITPSHLGFLPFKRFSLETVVSEISESLALRLARVREPDASGSLGVSEGPALEP